MVGTPINLTQRLISYCLIKESLVVLHLKTSEMAKEQERKVELPGVERRAFGLPCNLQIPMIITFLLEL